MATHWIEAWPEIAGRLAAPPRLLVACDFDGTLAPFVADPGKAQLPAAALEVLRRVLSAPGVSLAIISGRSLADIETRIPLPGVIFGGNHGLELRGLGLDGARSQAAVLRPRLQAVGEQLQAALGEVPGLRIENKELSLTVHLRSVHVSYHDLVNHEVCRIRAGDVAFKLQKGNMVLELLPDIGWDKGSALNQIASRLGLPRCATFYAGDDTTDESVFTALPTAITVRVGKIRQTAARWSANDPRDVHMLLKLLAYTRNGGGGMGRMRPGC